MHCLRNQFYHSHLFLILKIDKNHVSPSKLLNITFKSHQKDKSCIPHFHFMELAQIHYCGTTPPSNIYNLKNQMLNTNYNPIWNPITPRNHPTIDEVISVAGEGTSELRAIQRKRSNIPLFWRNMPLSWYGILPL